MNRILLRKTLKQLAASIGLDPFAAAHSVAEWSLRRAVAERGDAAMIEELRRIVPDISRQEVSEDTSGSYAELKRRGMHAFQCRLMTKALEGTTGKISVVDIGDSAGTHMTYLAALAKGRLEIETISVNLNKEEVERIQAKGMRAVHCRAEDLDLGGQRIGLYTAFQMVEHLSSPIQFFRRLATDGNGDLMVVTVPYLRRSRVGLHTLRSGRPHAVVAEEEHIFELSPEDWSLLMLHSGWRVIHSDVCYQYPVRVPVFRSALGTFWRLFDFEGFWGCILVRDRTLSDRYLDW